MADLAELPILEANPAEVAQAAAAIVAAMAGHAGAIEIGGALFITMKALALAQKAPQGVMHVAEHHQGHGATSADLGDRQGQIAITPVAGGAFPVPTAEGAGIGAQARGPGMGQQHQGQLGIGRQGRPADAIGRLLLGHRSIDRTNSSRQGEATASGERPAADHGQTGGGELPQAPAAMELPQQLQLLAQPLATAVFTGVVVTGDAGDGELQLVQQGGNAGVTIAEIADEQQGIRPDQIQQQMVGGIPLVMEVAGDGDVEVCQAGRLPSLWPILPEPRKPLVFSQVSTPHSAPPAAQLRAAIRELCRVRKAVILAHYYQDDAIQDVADFIGDSLELSRKAASTEAEVIVFCGVHFMAETAKILNPGKIVLVPDLEAGCSLADACPAEAFAAFRAQHPDHYVVSYINCSAAVKAQSDLICTSSNAVQLIQQLPAERPILFAPDQNLGRWVARQTGRELTFWPGSCIVHESFSEQALLQLRQQHPEAEVIAHPECQQHLLDLADFIGSTSKLLERVTSSPAASFIVLTEPGILHQMRRRAPEKTFLDVPGSDGCSCNTCPYMRLNTMDKLWRCLDQLEPGIELEESLRRRALAPIERMLAMSA